MICLFSYLERGLFCGLIGVAAIALPVVADIGGVTPNPSVVITENLLSLVPSNANQSVPEPIQKWRDTVYNDRYLSPWRRQKPFFDQGLDWFVRIFQKSTYYGENKQPIDPTYLQSIAQNMDCSHYQRLTQKAITVTNTSLRVIPTTRPFFLSFDLPGEGYPFDYAQESGIPANTPIMITHYTLDGAWILVETAELAGWLPVQDVASIYETQTALFEKQPYVAVIRDQVPVKDIDEQFLWKARIGMVLPVSRETSGSYQVWVAKRGTDGKAIFTTARLSAKVVQPKPIPLTAASIAEIGNQLMNQPYGWGDLVENRDCSSMLADLFAPFGLWLPRNGNDQGRFGGYAISLAHLSPKDKEITLIKNGIPFFTLLWLKGHIMLYVGTASGRALVFHNLWGLRTLKSDGSLGRYVIGKAVVTTLQPGNSLPNADPDGDLLKRLDMMTILMPRFY